MEMFVSPPSGRAHARASISRIPALTVLSCALMIAVLLTMNVGDAGAKKKKKDKKAPYVTKTTTVDSDNDGKVDGVILNYSEKVKLAKIKTGKGKVKKKDKKKTPWKAARLIGAVSVLSGGKSISVQLAEGDAADSAERPTITYIRVPKGAKGVVDLAGNQALTASIRAEDGLPPVPQSADALDTDSNGKLDTVRIAYSEAVKDAAASQFVVGGYTVTGATASGTTVDVKVAEQGIDTAATPTVASISGAVKDQAGNEQSAEFSVVAVDRAAPAVVDAVTADTNSNGRIDRVTVKFSEVISHVAETGTGAVAAVGLTSSAVSTAAVDTIVVDLNELGGGYTTHLKPDVVTAATANPVRDANGNTTGASTFKGTRDGAPPLLMSARSKDADGDGKIDQILATFSEPVTYTAGGSSYFSSTEPELGGFTTSATASGSVVTANLSENGPSAYNGQLNNFPVTYTTPGSGGAADAAGNLAATKTVNATDGAGPAIVYAETVDSAPADGHIDGVKIGFSEPVTYLGGNPFKIASGLRIIVDTVGSSTDGTQKIVGGSPGDPLYGGITIPLYPLTIDGTTNGVLADPDGADKPTIDYATVTSGSTKTAYAEDANHNEVIPTGSTAFTATLDRVKPILTSMQAADSNNDGYIDRLMTTWTETISTDGSVPFAALSPSNAPASGYTPPTVAAGAIASGPGLTVPLNPASLPDRDLYFETQYQPSGGSDMSVVDGAGNNAGTSPALPLTTMALCNDSDERDTLGQDDTFAYADPGPLANPNENALATMCGADRDYFSFSAGSGETVKVLLAISPGALALRAGNSYNPFDAQAPGGGSVPVSVSFNPSSGWIGTFTAGTAGTYKLGVGDSESPLLDFGYCISRTDDGSDPSCSLSQGDFVMTEMLNEVGQVHPDVGPFVEFKNVTDSPITIDAGYKLNVTGMDCPINPYSGTSSTIPAGGYMYITSYDDPNKSNDFECTMLVNGFDLGQPIALNTFSGTIDSVDFSSVTPPPTHSIQLRDNVAWQNSSANDDLDNGWCVSINSYGTWGTQNDTCDQFRINEVRFLPNSSRDGQTYIELKGSGAVTQVSAMLAGWRIRVKPKGMAGAIFELPANATPTAHGVFVLADSPASGDTQVPLYSVQSKDVSAGDTATSGSVNGRTLDSYLRADTPTTVKLLRPTGGDPFACDATVVDTLGYKPNNVGPGPLATPADDDGLCGVPFLTQQFMPPSAGYQTDDSIQRDNGYQYMGNNNIDFCATLGTPLQLNNTCFGEV